MEDSQQLKTWLDKLEQQLKIDIDCMDPAEAVKLLPFKPVDQTSNQRLVYEQLISPMNREMFLETAHELKSQGWEVILERMSAQLCAKNIENISGRVLLQSSPFYAYDTEKVVAQARRYATEFERVGISKDRFCIKIPCTGPAMVACSILLKEDIRTLGTCLTCLPQAVAASQAGCLSISPYYNLPCYHADAKLWPNVEDPALDHPMSSRIYHISQTYKSSHEKTGKVQPLLKPASFKSPREAMAMGELGCEHATIPEDSLHQLQMLNLESNPPAGGASCTRHAGIPSSRLAKLATIDPLAGPSWNGKIASADTDYLADNGAALTKAIGDDPATKQALPDALQAFEANELQSKAAIEEILKHV